MTQRKEDNELKKLFRQGMEQAPDGFTRNLMDQIEAEENITASIMQQAGTEAAPAHFVHNIMQQLGIQEQTTLAPYKPVISWKGWTLVAIIVGIIAGLIIKGSPENTFTTPDWASNLQSLAPTSLGIPSFILVAIGGVLALLLVEQVIRRATVGRRR